MKNIHLIPTDKPSRLYEFGGQIILTNELTDAFRNQHIYITSDEEIKEGDWIFDLDIKRIVKADNLRVLTSKATGCWYYKKIILTTDQDLIKDGVQSIDDEFLEWYIENPKCEWVKVESGLFFYADGEDIRYKIIIPQKIPKQERSYSEEEVRNLFRKYQYDIAQWVLRMEYDIDGRPIPTEWFEQFKKK